MQYGLPYKGSKSKIADWILEYLPSGENFYDLFTGGGAMTHAAILSGKYQNIYANDVNDAVSLLGEVIREDWTPSYNWLNREEFKKTRSYNAFNRIVYSFGNNQKDYLYSKEIEPYKEAMHEAIVNDNYEPLENLKIDDKVICEIKRAMCGNTDINVRRISACRVAKNYPALARVQHLEHLERIKRIEKIGKLRCNLEISVGDYQRVKIKPNSVVYCDIPYKNTAKYLCDFDYEAFYEWCKKQEELTIISEYSLPRDQFIEIVQKQVTKGLSPTAGRNLKAIEKLYIPIHQKELYKGRMAKWQKLDYSSKPEQNTPAATNGLKSSEDILAVPTQELLWV